MKKTNYPESIRIVKSELSGKCCLYMLLVEPLTYKFGITKHIQNRLRQHYRDLNFQEVVIIYDCKCEFIMSKTENRLKKLASNNKELITKYNKTEIIQTVDINKYLIFVENEIKMMQLRKPKVISEYFADSICALCNKIFIQRFDLIEHYKICKVIGYSLNTSSDYGSYEQKIRMIKTRQEMFRKKICHLEDELDQLLCHMMVDDLFVI